MAKRKRYFTGIFRGTGMTVADLERMIVDLRSNLGVNKARRLKVFFAGYHEYTLVEGFSYDSDDRPSKLMFYNPESILRESGDDVYEQDQ